MKYLKLFENEKYMKLGDYTDYISFRIAGVEDSSMKSICKCTYSNSKVLKFNCYIIDPRQYGKKRVVGPISRQSLGKLEIATEEEIKLYNILDKANQFDL